MKHNYRTIPSLAALMFIAGLQLTSPAVAAITDALTVHLKFDGDFNDATANKINGTPMAVGTTDTTGPGFMPGILGQAVHIIVSSDNKTNQYVSLGYPPLLHFGSDATADTTDFSVSMWLKIFGSSGDEPFISNKNWDSGGNLGWVVSNEPDGVRLNLKDDINGRKDMTGHSSPQLEDGHWHHLVVTFQRTNIASIYMDSILDTTHLMFIGPDPGNAVGSLDTDSLGNSVNLGQDGTGQYNVRDTTGLNCLMDDVGIWRRVLTADEVAQIYSAGLQGLDIEQSTNAGAFFQAAQPSPGAVGVPGVGTVAVEIQAGASPINQGSIVVKLDGQTVSPTITRTGVVTSISLPYGSSQPLPPLSSHTVSVVASDTGTPPRSITNIWSFAVVRYSTVPGTYALPAGSANTPGMLYRSVWASTATPYLPNTLDRAAAQLDGTLIDPSTGQPFGNDATPGTLSYSGTTGYYAVDVVNFNEMGTDAGDIPGDACFPGMPCGVESDSFATEAITFIPLQPGYYRWGVNSDDDFRLSVANPAQSFQSTVVGEFGLNGRGASDTTFDFVVTQPGVYQFRLIYEQGNGGASEEWWSVDLASGQKTLINATNTTAIKAYRALSGVAPAPFVRSVAPTPGDTAVIVAPLMSAEIVDGASPIVPASVQLKLNGTAITGLSLSKAGPVTTVAYQVPMNTPLALGTAYTASLTYGDASGTNTAQWTFSIHPAITGALVCHLPLDGDYTDWSGQGVNGTPMALGTTTPAVGPTFEAGQIGQAVHLIATKDETINAYVSLGYPAPLRMGSDLTGDASDFSIAFWEKMNSSTADEPFISNFDWDSSSDLGWVISNEGGGMRFDYHDRSGSDKRDTGTFSVPLQDGNWHHVTVTFKRHGFANIYVDGVLTNSINIEPDWGLPAASVDTYDLNPGRGPGTFAWNLGEDGTGDYAVNNGAAIDVLMDDVGIWRRVLAADEVANIYQLGLAGNTFAAKILPAIHINAPTLSSGQLTLTWTGGNPPFVVQMKSNLTDSTWVNAQTNTAPTASFPALGIHGFFRVVGQ